MLNWHLMLSQFWLMADLWPIWWNASSVVQCGASPSSCRRRRERGGTTMCQRWASCLSVPCTPDIHAGKSNCSLVGVPAAVWFAPVDILLLVVLGFFVIVVHIGFRVKQLSCARSFLSNYELFSTIFFSNECEVSTRGHRFAEIVFLMQNKPLSCSCNNPTPICTHTLWQHVWLKALDTENSAVNVIHLASQIAEL